MPAPRAREFHKLGPLLKGFAASWAILAWAKQHAARTKPTRMAAPLISADALGMILFWLLALALGSGSMVLGILGPSFCTKVPFVTGPAMQGLQPVPRESTARGDGSSNSRRTMLPAPLEYLRPESKFGIAPRLRPRAGRLSHFLPSVSPPPVLALLGQMPRV
jgi:hypothetical protein